MSGDREARDDEAITLCVLLWAREGCEQLLMAYEDEVLPLVAEHGGVVLQRARTKGDAGEPLEVHLIRFHSPASFDRYMADERRAALAETRHRAVARTEVLRVDLI